MHGSRTAEVLHVPLGGLDLLIRRKPGVPAVTLGYYVPRDASEAPEMAGVGALAMRSIIRGAGPLDGAALAFAAEGLGGTLGASAGIDWAGLSLPVLSENLARAATLLRLAAFEPPSTKLDVLTERGLLLEEARQVADDMFRYPFLLAFGAAFRDRGYGRPVGGTVDTLPHLGIEDVRAWHRTSFAGRRGALVVVGDLDPDAAAAELAGVFGDVPGGAVAPPRARQLVQPRSGRLAAGGIAREGTDGVCHGVPRPRSPRPEAPRGRCVGRGGKRTGRPAVRRAARPAFARLHRGGHGVAAPRWRRASSPISPRHRSARTRRAPRC